MSRLLLSLRVSNLLRAASAPLLVLHIASGGTGHAQESFAVGYADRTSYAPGDAVRFHLSARIGAETMGLRIARIGRETIEKAYLSGIAVEEHPVPEDASSRGCRWPEAATVKVGEEWESGYYEARPVWNTGDGAEASGTPIRFIVRAATPGRDGAILMHLATNTENAYCNFGGYSLYAYNGKDGIQGHRVSFLRPMSGFAHTWEMQFIRWAESNGYRLEYCANADLEFVPGLLEPYRLVVSVGHDEYWSKGMRDALDDHLGRGGNAAFFTGNTCCWQVRFENGGTEMVSWKQRPDLDPLFADPGRHGELSTLWSHHLVKRPENELLGVGFLFGGYHRSHGQHMDGSGGFTVHRNGHWVFEGTRLEAGQSFGSADTIVGYECDGCEFAMEDGLPVPTGSDGTPASFTILATAPARWHPDDSEWYERWEKGREGAACMGVIEDAGGTRGSVFAAATTDWSHGLAGGDPVVERITRNVLDRLSGFDPQSARAPGVSRAMLVAREGFVVEEMASEPLVTDPVAFDWDARGRLWVAQMNDYPLAATGGRISVLEDTDSDGRYDASIPFLEGIPFPTGIMTWRDGVIVTSAPEIFFAADRDGDGRADHRETLFAGFREGNQQHRVNGPRHTLDNLVSIANGDSGGSVRSIRTGEEFDLRGRDLLVDPDTGAMWPSSGMTQFGRNRDDWGNWFGCNNPNPGWHYVVEERYVVPEASVQPPFIRRDLTEARSIFPISLPLLHSIDIVEPAPGRPGRFTAANSILPFRDARWGPAFERAAFVSEPVYNVVHRMQLLPDGTSFRAARAEGEEAREFLASRDPWFRPTELRVGPDGALWVADMYRLVLEHPEWIPEGLKHELDLYAGSDRGRIYRIFPRSLTMAVDGIPTMPSMEDGGLDDLVDRLSSPNGWIRDKAQRLLLERGLEGDAGQIADRVRRLLRTSDSPQARLHALYLLPGLASLEQQDVHGALEDPHPEVRRHAMRLAEATFAKMPRAIRDAAVGASPGGAYQAILSARAWAAGAPGDVRDRTDVDDFADCLAEASLRHGGDPLLRWAILTSAAGHADRVLVRLIASASGVDGELMAVLAREASPSARAEIWKELAASRSGARPSADDYRLATSLLQGAPGPVPPDWLAAARSLLESDSAANEDRLAAAGFLAGCASAEESVLDELVRAFMESEPGGLRDGLATLLSTMEGPQAVGVRLVSEFADAEAPIRNALARILAQRTLWAVALLDSVSDAPDTVMGLAPDVVRLFRNHVDAAVRDHAAKVLGADVRPDRAMVFEDYRAAIDGSIEGSRDAGAAVYAARCAICHDARADGPRIGPDLAMLESPSRTELLAAIIDPNRAVEEKYLQNVVTLRDGRALVGAVADEAASGFRLRMVDGSELQVARSSIASLEPLGVSLMPEGLEAGLSVEEMAGLLLFLADRGGEPKRFAGNTPGVVRVGPDDEVRELPARSAAIHGPSLVFEQRHQNLGFWASQDDLAEWQLDLAQPGRYEIWAELACPSEIAWQAFRIESPTGHLVGSASDTSGWDNYNWRYVGVLELVEGAQTLRVRSDGEVRGHLMDLRALRLVRLRD